MGILFKVLPKVLPLVPAVVKLVEKLFGGGKGPEKRSAAVEVLRVLIPLVEGVTGKDLVEDGKFADAVGAVIDGVVAALNATGAFKKENL